MIKRIDYINLTNGIEAIPLLPPEWHVCRIRSTDIERNHWAELIVNLDHDLLFNLSQGYHCVIHDYGCRRELSKTVKVAIPVIKSLLELAWFGVEMPESYAPIATSILIRAETNMAREAKRKLVYYRKLLATEIIRLTGVSRKTIHDGDFDYYRNILKVNHDQTRVHARTGKSYSTKG